LTQLTVSKKGQINYLKGTGKQNFKDTFLFPTLSKIDLNAFLYFPGGSMQLADSNGSTFNPSPLKLQPLYMDKIWGGQALKTKLSKDIPSNLKIGESWEISGVDGNQTSIADGAYKGKALGELCSQYGAEILGPIDTENVFPLLYKFIDANDKLSVQVHPDDNQAQYHGWGRFGKTECWYIVDAPEGASIIVGLKKSLTREEMADAIAKGTFRQLLTEEPVVPGDMLFIPAGTIHAIMANTIIFEVQQSSDVTLRVYDWDRVDDSGKPRALHIQDAVKITDTKAYGSFKIKPVAVSTELFTYSVRVACKYFAIEQYDFNKEGTCKLPAKKSFSTITLLDGTLLISDSSGTTNLTKGESVVLPASLNDVTMSGSKGSKLLVSSVPDLYNEIIKPLSDKGIAKQDIIGLGGVVPERNDLLSLL
jgi:mannose-6-phosphate isomerase